MAFRSRRSAPDVRYGDGITAELDEAGVLNLSLNVGAVIAADEVTADSTTLVGVGATVQAVLEELDNGIADHLADTSAAHAASAISASSTTLVGVATDVQGVLEELDNGIADHLADTAGAHNASAITVDSTTLAGVGTDAQAVFEELDNSIAALEGVALVKRLTFTETAGAGTYTAEAVLPAGAVIHNIFRDTTAAWDADTTLIDIGHTGDLTKWVNGVDVDPVGSGANITFGYDANEVYFPSGTTITAAITTTGAGGTTGRTSVTVVYSVPPAATAAVKA